MLGGPYEGAAAQGTGNRKHELQEQLFFCSLEKIFAENRIYKDKQFEDSVNMDAAVAHVDKRLEPFKPSFIREVTRDDIMRLMEIKMARIPNSMPRRARSR